MPSCKWTITELYINAKSASKIAHVNEPEGVENFIVQAPFWSDFVGDFEKNFDGTKKTERNEIKSFFFENPN